MLDINPILLVVTLAVFISLIVYLNNVLYKPLLKYMDDREAKLKGDRDSVNQNSSEIEALKKESENILASARHEAVSIKETMISEAKESVAKKLLEKREALAESYKSFIEELEKDKTALRGHLLADRSSIEVALKDRFASI
jgi:F-type H+-transporting ATPase subunit b